MVTEESVKQGINTSVIAVTSDMLQKLVLQGKNISHLRVITDNDIELYDKYQSGLIKNHVSFLTEIPSNNISIDDIYSESANQWIFPKIYQELNVKTWLMNKCKTSEEKNRVEEEFAMYESRGLVMLLRLFIFLIDYMRKNKFVWGVGRGSAVSSYCLYLIGVHRVHSLKYGLDIKEFLK